MIKHVVMWKLKPEAAGAGKQDNAKKLKEELEALNDKIEEIRYIEVGINISDSDAASDVVLYSEFESLDDLQAYREHPEHVKVGRFVGEVRSERTVVDYEV